jgi:hypothetical protein
MMQELLAIVVVGVLALGVLYLVVDIVGDWID